MRKFFTYLGFSLLVGFVLLYPDLSLAQTIRVDSSRTDSMFVSVKAGGTTFDTARVVWSYNGAAGARVLRANQTDTIRLVRAVAPVAKRDALALDYYTYPKAKQFNFGVAARVVIPPVTPPVSPPATGPVTTPADYVVPALPLAWVPDAPAPQRRVDVPAGASLQAVFNSAQPGDELVLANGARFSGNFTLPPKVGSGWITVRCADSLPVGRVVPGSNNCATINTPNESAALFAAPYSARWWFTGVQITHDASQHTKQNYGIVVLGSGASSDSVLAALPTDFVFDRVQVRGALTVGSSRCFAFNGARMAVIDSYLTECHAKGFDAQGVGGWNGPGPFLIENNRIEASGMAVLFGGADPWIPGVVPSDITVRGNDLYKPLSWGRGVWTVKAAFELKNAKRVLFERNTIENHWADAQVGFAILLQTLADNNRTWATTTVADVTIRHNVIRNSTSGANVLARVAYNGGTMPTNPTSRVLLQHNLFEHVGRDPITGTAGIGLQLMGDLFDFTATHNTFTLAGSAQKMLSFDGNRNVSGQFIGQTRTTITDNIFAPSSYPLTGNATGAGRLTLDVFMPGGVFQRNTLPGARVQDFNTGALGNAAGADTALIKALTARVVR